jgi:hypothetical protein
MMYSALNAPIDQPIEESTVIAGLPGFSYNWKIHN